MIELPRDLLTAIVAKVAWFHDIFDEAGVPHDATEVEFLRMLSPAFEIDDGRCPSRTKPRVDPVVAHPEG
jgi:hypothetical protein